MPSKSVSKAHLKNVIKITIGHIRRKRRSQKSRRRQQLVNEAQQIHPIVVNVSNPQGSNSSTLLNKIQETEINAKLHNLQQQLNNVPVSTPSTTTRRESTLLNPVENTSTLAEVSQGITRSIDDNKQLQHFQRFAPSLRQIANNKYIKEPPAPSSAKKSFFGRPEPLEELSPTYSSFSESSMVMTPSPEGVSQPNKPRGLFMSGGGAVNKPYDETTLRSMNVNDLRAVARKVLGNDARGESRKYHNKQTLVQKILEKNTK